MPMYEYTCRDCGHRFEKLSKTFAAPAGLTAIACPACESNATTRELSTFAVGGEPAKSVPVAQGCGRCGGPNPCSMN